MIFRKFNCSILFISTFLGGCTFFQDQDEELLPAELVKYDELLNIKKVWGKGIGKGSEQLHLSLKPSGNSEVIYTASHDGKVSSIEAVSGRAFLKKEFGIKNLSIKSKDNNLNDVINFVRIYKNSPELIIFEKMLKSGSINTEIELYFHKDGKLKKNYQVKGLVKGAEVRLLNKEVISNIDLNFDIQNKLYLIKKTKIQYKGIKFSSNEIKILKQEKHFLIKGDIKNLPLKLPKLVKEVKIFSIPISLIDRNDILEL